MERALPGHEGHLTISPEDRRLEGDKVKLCWDRSIPFWLRRWHHKLLSSDTSLPLSQKSSAPDSTVVVATGSQHNPDLDETILYEDVDTDLDETFPYEDDSGDDLLFDLVEEWVEEAAEVGAGCTCSCTNQCVQRAQGSWTRFSFSGRASFSFWLRAQMLGLFG